MLAILALGCGSDGNSFTTEAAVPLDTAATAPGDTATAPGDTTITPDSTALPPSDSTILPPSDSTISGGTIPPADDNSRLPGIALGTYDMLPSYLGDVHTGTRLGASPGTILSTLAAIRDKGGRVVIKLCKGRDGYVKNADGTFSLSKWMANVSQYRNIDIAPFIADGTILGHFLIDEPHLARRWGGKPIPQATIEAMAAYSKQLWPGMATLVRVAPSWLAAAPVNYIHLDAGWLQYTFGKGEVTRLAAAEVASAKSKALGILLGLNVRNGGDGSSKIRGTGGRWAMSATELRTYGTALLNESYACGFFMWNHSTSYYGRPEVQGAMAELSAQARAHQKTSCRQ